MSSGQTKIMTYPYFKLVKEIPVRDKPFGDDEFGDIIDWKHEVIAESQTLRGIKSYVKMKKVEAWKEDCTYIVEKVDEHETTNIYIDDL